jgi:DNA-directed RNA polymerase subunit RPC12/RpoP
MEPHRRTSFRSTPPAPTAPLPSQSHSSSRIERASYRDPVGEQVVTTTSTKCTYLGIIEVTRHQFQEAGTTCVECPTCGARRTLKSRHPIGLIFHRIPGA